MNINDQLESFLADLGVEMEQAGHDYEYGHEGGHEQYDETSVPEVSIFQASRDHYGVFYRLDMIEHKPELRVIVPVEQGLLKMEVYLVRLSDASSLASGFLGMTGYEGSSAFGRTRDASMQHLLYAVAELMKQLFWSGDLNTLCFPEEIAVRRLV